MVALSTSATAVRGGGMAKRGLVAVVVGLRVVEGFGENLGCGLWKWSGEDSEAEDAIFVFD